MACGGVCDIGDPGYVPRRRSRARAACRKPSRAGTSRSAATARTALGPPGCHCPGTLLRGQGACEAHLVVRRAPNTRSPSGQDTFPIARGAGLSPAQRRSLNRHRQMSIQHPSLATLGPDVLGDGVSGVSKFWQNVVKRDFSPAKKSVRKMLDFSCCFDVQR